MTVSSSFLAACVQNRATGDPDAGLDEAERLARQAREAGARLICLPEFCHCLHVDGETFETGAAPEASHPAIERLSALAAELGAWLLVGSVAVDEGGERLRNRSLLLDESGRVIARYDKIHMFDVALSSGETYRESARFAPGDQAVVADTPFGAIGMTVCYDVRFAALYRTLAQNGARIMTVPAAFTHTTGKAHWQVLLRSRAIETGSFVIAPGQYGVHGAARTWGHSMIVAPWGEVLAEAGGESQTIIAAIDLARVEEARSRVPSLTHDRCFNPPVRPSRSCAG